MKIQNLKRVFLIKRLIQLEDRSNKLESALWRSKNPIPTNKKYILLKKNLLKKISILGRLLNSYYAQR